MAKIPGWRRRVQQLLSTMEGGEIEGYDDECAAPNDDGWMPSKNVMLTVRNCLNAEVVFGPEEISGMTTVSELRGKLVQGFARRFLLGLECLMEDCQLGRLALHEGLAEDEMPQLELSTHLDTTLHLELSTHQLRVFGPENGESISDDDAAVFSELWSTFTVTSQVGSGTFATVWKAMHRDGEETRPVAIKKLNIDSVEGEGGIPTAAIREVSLVKKLNHPNVARIHNVYATSSCLFLVFELLDMDLRKYMKRHGHFTDPDLLRRAARQCCDALHHCHIQRVIHRDLKPQNILVCVDGTTLKLADFGLARTFAIPLQPYTREVVTLWYRGPELLLGQRNYGPSLDIWSMACIIAEMAVGRPLFAGDSEIDTMFRIFRLLGTPSEEVWQDLNQLPYYQNCFPVWNDTELAGLREEGPTLGDDGIDLLHRSFAYDPRLRLSARQIMVHPFFSGIS